jgi:YD repeat-containing protein
MGVQADTVTQQLARIVEADYDGSGNLIYFGLAQPGTPVGTATWGIRKFTYDGSGNLLSVLWANGVTNFNAAWTGRAGLSYS